jgi:ElaB/YqjD/DUF883 family membrane-anchored ribosome-binding protein
VVSIIKRNGRKPRKRARGKQAQLGAFFSDVEDLLTRITHLPDEGIARVRERLESSLDSARTSMEEGVEKFVDTTTGAAKAADDYVQENPWRAIGVAAAACLVIGALLRRP